jgi:hypothetical protein
MSSCIKNCLSERVGIIVFVIESVGEITLKRGTRYEESCFNFSCIGGLIGKCLMNRKSVRNYEKETIFDKDVILKANMNVFGFDLS